MADRYFVDTNVLVYTRDASEHQKQVRAKQWMEYLWYTHSGRFSYQVLQEYYVVVTEKLEPGLKHEQARLDIRLLLTWQPVPVDSRILENAWFLQDHHMLSWWDALVVSAAQFSECSYILTEDLQEGKSYGKLVVTNPFHTEPPSQS
jgi:predicted nucleic acid-binding protein